MTTKPQFDLPLGTETFEVAFVSKGASEHPLLAVLPAPLPVQAVRIADAEASSLSLLLVPSNEGDLADATAVARRWVERHPKGEGELQSSPPSLLAAVQNAHLIWAPGRAALLAPAERLPLVRDAFLEAAYGEAELFDIERQIAASWAQLDEDIPCGFELRDRSSAKRRILRERFERVLRLRARLARTAPVLLRPHVYPPTIASQVGERIRERSRVAERVERLQQQLELFERTYELCSERVSGYLHARSSNRLEWVIIILLILQSMLWIVELVINSQS